MSPHNGDDERDFSGHSERVTSLCSSIRRRFLPILGDIRWGLLQSHVGVMSYVPQPRKRSLEDPDFLVPSQTIKASWVTRVWTGNVKNGTHSLTAALLMNDAWWSPSIPVSVHSCDSGMSLLPSLLCPSPISC